MVWSYLEAFKIHEDSGSVSDTGSWIIGENFRRVCYFDFDVRKEIRPTPCPGKSFIPLSLTFLLVQVSSIIMVLLVPCSLLYTLTNSSCTLAAFIFSNAILIFSDFNFASRSWVGPERTIKLIIRVSRPPLHIYCRRDNIWQWYPLPSS